MVVDCLGLFLWTVLYGYRDPWGQDYFRKRFWGGSNVRTHVTCKGCSVNRKAAGIASLGFLILWLTNSYFYAVFYLCFFCYSLSYFLGQKNINEQDIIVRRIFFENTGILLTYQNSILFSSVNILLLSSQLLSLLSVIYSTKLKFVS